MLSPGLWLPGWASSFKATRTGFPGYAVEPGGEIWKDWFGVLPESFTTAALTLDETVQGARSSDGATPAGVQAAVVAEGWALALGATSLTPGCAPSAVGARASAAAAVWEGGVRLQAIGLNPLPGAVLFLSGPQPLAIQGRALHGYHRPLGGEVASLTLIVARAHLFPGWLQAPPLGQACRVEYAGRWLMSGYLYAVRVTATAVELRIEG